MSDKRFDDILKRLPEIAAAVNEFKDPELQRRAFETLMSAAGLVSPGSSIPASSSSEKNKHSREKKKETINPTRNKGGAKRNPDQYQIVDVDLHPEGLASLRSFFEQKKPKSDPEKYSCIVYYMLNIAEIQAVNVDHVFTAFKQLGLKVPNIRGGLQNTRARHGWVDFKASGPITLTRIGANFVEHELPRHSEGGNGK